MWSWDDAVHAIRSARNPQNPGKPIKGSRNAYARLAEGTKENPEIIHLIYHQTAIIVLYPDGSRDICTGWSSKTTIERLAELGGVSVWFRDLPAINGYRPSPERGYFMTLNRGRDGWVPFNGNKYGPRGEKYIHVKPGFEIDMETVVPHNVQCITNPTKLRKTMRHVGRISQLLYGYAKLKGNESFRHGKGNLTDWLLARYHMPLEEIQLSPFPYIHNEDNLKGELKKAADLIRWTIARQEECIGNIDIMKPR